MEQAANSKMTFKKAWTIIRVTFKGYSEDKGAKLSASLAYTTIFSLGPLLLLVMSLASIFYGADAVEGKVFSQINGLIGSSAATQVQEIIKNIRLSGKTNIAFIIGLSTLVLGATSLFVEIQDSLNTIWRVKPKPKKSWLSYLKNRLLSASLIVSLVFLLVVSLVVNGLLQALSDKLAENFSGGGVVLLTIINLFINLCIFVFVFGVIFKVLPDAKIKWRDVRTGAMFTAVLFMVGQFLIGLYIKKTGTGSAYGAAGSIIIILSWVYYTSSILYLGAEFTQAYSEATGSRIEPADYAVHVVQKEQEKDVSVLPVQHKEDMKKAEE